MRFTQVPSTTSATALSSTRRSRCFCPLLPQALDTLSDGRPRVEHCFLLETQACSAGAGACCTMDLARVDLLIGRSWVASGLGTALMDEQSTPKDLRR